MHFSWPHLLFLLLKFNSKYLSDILIFLWVMWSKVPSSYRQEGRSPCHILAFVCHGGTAALTITSQREAAKFFFDLREVFKANVKFWPILALKFEFLIQKTIFQHCGGSQKCIFCAFFCLWYTAIWPWCDRVVASVKEELEVVVVGWKWLFSCGVGWGGSTPMVSLASAHSVQKHTTLGLPPPILIQN